MIKIKRVGLPGPEVAEFWLLLTGTVFVLNDAKGYGKKNQKALWMKVEDGRAMLVTTGKFTDLDSKRLVRVVRAKITYEDHDEWDPLAFPETPVSTEGE